MRPVYDDFEDFDFVDSPALGRIIREQRREERRHLRRKPDWRRAQDFIEIDELADVHDVDEYHADQSEHFALVNKD